MQLSVETLDGKSPASTPARADAARNCRPRGDLNSCLLGPGFLCSLPHQHFLSSILIQMKAVSTPFSYGIYTVGQSWVGKASLLQVWFQSSTGGPTVRNADSLAHPRPALSDLHCS